MQIGEGVIGEGYHLAHVITVCGYREGPVGAAWVAALGSPMQDHVPSVATLQPNLPVKPMTLFITKSTVKNARHRHLTWGPVQLGVACGVADALEEKLFSRADVDRMLILAYVWVDPAAVLSSILFENNRRATLAALNNGVEGYPTVDDILVARNDPRNANYQAQSNLDKERGSVFNRVHPI